MVSAETAENILQTLFPDSKNDESFWENASVELKQDRAEKLLEGLNSELEEVNSNPESVFRLHNEERNGPPTANPIPESVFERNKNGI